MSLRATADVPGGDVATTWSGDGVTVVAAGQPGSQVALSPPVTVVMAAAGDHPGFVTKTASASVVPEQPPSGTSFATLAHQYAGSGRSVY